MISFGKTIGFIGGVTFLIGVVKMSINLYYLVPTGALIIGGLLVWVAGVFIEAWEEERSWRM